MNRPLTFLDRVSAADRAALEQRWSVRRCDRNEMILAQEEESRDVFFVLEGRVRATAYSERGRAVTYRDIGAGEIFGELAAIDGQSRSASIMALEPTRIAGLSDAVFRQIVESHPAFAWTLLVHLSAQVRRMTERVYEFSTLVVRKRLIRELIRLAGEREDSTGQGSISPAPTHSDLAAKIGTHREAVSREMSNLAKTKLIAKRGRTLVLNDIEMLALLGSDEE